MANYVLNLKLDTEKYQENILKKRFELGRKLYNSILNISLKRYKEMVKTRVWRDNQKNISNIY
ncbi:MAG: transposase, partial [Sarcina sp.]